MKKMKTILFVVITCFILVSLQSCKYDEGEEYKPQAPYYQFTSQDKLWFDFKLGDSLKFENANGRQQLYIIIEIIEEIKKGAGQAVFGFFGPGNPKYYYDGIKVEFKRLDTLNYNTIEFRRTLPRNADSSYPPAGKGEFQFGGFWENYTGGFVFDGISGNINVVAGQLALQNTSQLIVRGKTYRNIMVISPGQLNGSILGDRKPYINELYYDQKGGVVRMVSKSGEIWDRIP